MRSTWVLNPGCRLSELERKGRKKGQFPDGRTKLLFIAVARVLVTSSFVPIEALTLGFPKLQPNCMARKKRAPCFVFQVVIAVSVPVEFVGPPHV